ncbi:Type I restriction-modification system, specificity subunit S [Tritonibacter mobilis]|uniref:restriction endonuclease subunit S n=1 Tax=Tritonibacter mobilis TaxID=379347 RepID=UPI000F708A87|nr:restriction endonuclease subunit S [Tritonibacter mobilis]VCU62050.1 Type I restriction-modification system, specificity subunit S [Tritonibacter mobilis]
MKTVGDAADFLSGGTPRKSTAAFWNGDIPWFSASNMTVKFLSCSDVTITEDGLKAGSRMAPSGSTLLLVRGSGLFNHIPICYADRDVAFNQDVKAIVARDGVDPLYLHYTLEAHRRELANNLGVTGIGAGKFDTDFVKELRFVARSQEEQAEIGQLASAYDRKIELNRRMNETLEEMARALFRDWFVDFGPTRRQAEGATDPAAIMGHAFPPEKATTLAPLFPAKLGDDGLPEGWAKASLKSLGSVVTGKTPSTKKQEYYGADVPFLKIPDMHGKSFVLNTGTMLSALGAYSQAKKTVPAGSVSVSCIATPGLVVLNHRDTQTNQQINTVIPNQPSHQYFMFWSCREIASEVMIGGSGGSVFHNMNKTTFEGLEVIFPGDREASLFGETVKPFHNKVLANEQENQTLAEMRDLLLPKLMSGEIRLKDVEAAL